MKILAIDPATEFGYCYDPEEGKSGSVKMGGSKKTKAEKLSEFYGVIGGLIILSKPDAIIYERPAGGHFTGVQFHCNLEGILIILADQVGIPAVPVSAKTIKKFITGNGNAKKEEMVAKIKETYPHVTNHNEADAIGIYLYAKENIKEI